MKIAALVSGGVDSSVALRQLQADGHHDITAFYLKIWLEDELSFLGECPWEEDLKYVTQVCDEAGVPLEVISLQREYWERVVSHTIAELKAGRTPSPDILCNQRIKFGAFCDHLAADFEKIATGHYAWVEEERGTYWLEKGLDPVKDQTYFLSHLSQAQLSRCLFPVGRHQKSEVRRLATAYALPNRDRPDSQGICFLGKIKYNEFVKYHLGEQEGEIREWETDRVLGAHKGYWFHTVGQRKGLGLGGGPWFVVQKDVVRNRIYVSRDLSKDLPQRHRFTVGGVNWLSQAPEPGEMDVKIRHGARTIRATVTPLDATSWDVSLAEADPGIAAGQYAVFYHGQRCLGGGVISH